MVTPDRSPAVVRMLVVGLATALAVATGCSDDDPDRAGPSDRVTTTTSSTTTTSPDPAIDAALEATAAIDEAGNDLCAIDRAAALVEGFRLSDDPETIDAFVSVTVRLYRAYAEAAPPEQGEAAAALRTAADGLEAEAAEPGFDLEALSTSPAMTAEPVRRAINEWVGPGTANCG